jgi:hypothetical protein
VRIDDALDPIRESERGPSSRIKWPKRGSLSHSSKNAAKEKMGRRIFFSATKRAKRFSGRDVKNGFQLAFRGLYVPSNFPEKESKPSIKL